MKELTDEQYIKVGKAITVGLRVALGEADDGPSTDTPVQRNATALLDKLKEWEGLHEKRDREKIMQIFRDAGFEFDPDLPWCGAGLRAGCCHVGLPDIGTDGFQAAKWATYGVEVTDDPQVGDIWVSNTHVGVIAAIRDDGIFMIIGCNQSNGICIHPVQNRDGKKNYGDMIAIRRAV